MTLRTNQEWEQLKFDELLPDFAPDYDRLVAENFFSRWPEQDRIFRAILSTEASKLFRHHSGEKVLAVINLVTNPTQYPTASLNETIHFALRKRNPVEDDRYRVEERMLIDRAGDAAKRVVYALRRRLAAFYGVHTDGPKILIDKHYMPSLSEPPDVSSSRVSVPNSGSDLKRDRGGSGPPSVFGRLKKDAKIHCAFLGNAEDGAKYVIRCCRKKHGVTMVRNTYVRLKYHHGKYLKETLTGMIKCLAKVVARDRSETDDPCIYELFGGYVETEYLRELINVATEQAWNSKLSMRWLHPKRGPIMNFIILDYANGKSEVLFGWGRHHDQWRGEVFLSRDSHVVKEFAEFFSLLRTNDVSHELSLQQLQAKLTEMKESRKGAPTALRKKRRA